MDNLVLNGMTLILGIDMNTSVSAETHVTYDKPLILMENKQIDLFKYGQNLRTIFLKLETELLDSSQIKF
jgi:hypothetical protein